MNRLQLMASLATAVVAATSAHAATLTFVLRDPADGLNLSWEQSSTPTPNDYATGQAADVPTITAFDPPYFDVSYFNANPGGGFYVPNDTLNLFGPRIYSGTEASPVFAPGVYHGVYGSWTLGVTAVPEPAAWATMLLGFSLVGALARARRTVVARGPI